MSTQYNIVNNLSVEDNYQVGLLPQRNQVGSYYHESSCRSDLLKFSLSSENRRILKKTNDFLFTIQPVSEFVFDLKVQELIYNWIKELRWKFPISSVKYLFSRHIFNRVYTWTTSDSTVIAYSLCYFSPKTTIHPISHVAYVFYNPKYHRTNFPIRLVLQVIIDSHDQEVEFCYLGRFSPPEIGYYKRTMPGFEYFQNNNWKTYK